MERAFDNKLLNSEFPVGAQWVYMNHAGVAPLSRRAALAMQRIIEDALSNGAVHYNGWIEEVSRLRKAGARLIGADPSEIAVVKNTSEGILTIALGFPWQPGDVVVGFKEEFPANYFPWRRLERRGVQTRWLSVLDSWERIEEACKGARLVAVSYVQFLSGYRIDLVRLGQICKDYGCFFFVDAIQGLGALKLDVEEARIDALAADGHKWLLGPEGCGILYVRQKWQEIIEPVEFGWLNAANYRDYSNRDMTPRPDAGRYECGSLNVIGCAGLAASIELLLEVGIEQIETEVLKRSQRLAEGALKKGYELAVPWTPGTASGIVALRKRGINSAEIVQRAREQGIVVAERLGWVRCSPHFYVSEEGIERFLELLP